MATTFSNKCKILGQLWIDYSKDENLKEFITYNDLGLPLAYASSEKLANLTDNGITWVEETWDLFIGSLSTEDTGFENITEVFESVE
jgi:hypothetical protein